MLCSPGLASNFPKYPEPILCPCGKIWREGWVCVAQTTATRSVVVRVVCHTPFSSSPLSAINMFAAVVCRDLLAPHLESNTSLFFHNVKKKKIHVPLYKFPLWENIFATGLLSQWNRNHVIWPSETLCVWWRAGACPGARQRGCDLPHVPENLLCEMPEK